MITIIKKINLGILIGIVGLIVSGLVLMAIGKEKPANDILFVAALAFPFSLAGKGIEFIVENQILKASLSIVILSLVCMLSIIFVFA